MASLSREATDFGEVRTNGGESQRRRTTRVNEKSVDGTVSGLISIPIVP